MPKFFTPRVSRVNVGFAVVAAVAAFPMVAQAGTADTELAGTLSAGSLTNTAPAIASFGATLTGVTQDVTTPVGDWGVTDATGSNAGYVITVAASAPAVAGGSAGTGGSISLTPRDGVAAVGNTNSLANGPKAVRTTGDIVPIVVTSGAAPIVTAATNTGQGAWDFPADINAEERLGVVIPGDASAGDYSSTLTFTSAMTVTP
jgi:hypothetical protein